jgi:hypothetical protein
MALNQIDLWFTCIGPFIDGSRTDDLDLDSIMMFRSVGCQALRGVFSAAISHIGLWEQYKGLMIRWMCGMGGVDEIRIRRKALTMGLTRRKVPLPGPGEAHVAVALAKVGRVDLVSAIAAVHHADGIFVMLRR